MVRRTPPPCCAGPAVPTSTWRSGSAPTCPSAWSGGRARVRGWGSGSPHFPSSPRVPASPAALRRGHGPVYRAWDDGSPRTIRPTRSPPRPWPSSPAWPAGAMPWGSWRDASRCWPAAARPGSSRSAQRRGGGAAGVTARRGRDGPAGACPHRAGGLGRGLRRGRERGARRGVTCRPVAASGWPSASSCASSCASACGAF